MNIVIILTCIPIVVVAVRVAARLWSRRRDIAASVRETRASTFVRGYYRRVKNSGIDIDTDVVKVLLGCPTNGVFVRQLMRFSPNRAFVEKINDVATAKLGNSWLRSEPGNIAKCMLEIEI